jgi:glucan biosynthesis protein C
MKTIMERLHYIDNIRWICSLLLFPVHAAVVFAGGVHGYYVQSSQPSMAAQVFLGIIIPRIMPLLFCVAGMSTRFAFAKRTPARYLNERVTKLLVPFITGVIVVCPVLAYYALKFHTDYTGSFADAFVYFFSTLPGFQRANTYTGGFTYGHLWFILYLFIVSVLALGIILLVKRAGWDQPREREAALPLLVLLFIPIWLLNNAGYVQSGFSLLSYLALFLIGYYLISRDTVQQQLEHSWRYFLCAWVVLTLVLLIAESGALTGAAAGEDPTSPLFSLTGWIGVLAFIGTGRHLINRTGPFAAYMGAAAYPVYIIH